MAHYTPAGLTFLLILTSLILLPISTASPTPSSQSQPPPPSPKLSKCEQACHNETPCLQKCKLQWQETMLAYIGITFGFVLFFVVCCGCCFLSSHHKFRKFRLFFDRRFWGLKGKYKVVAGGMGRSEFQQHSRLIVKLFNMSTVHGNFISSIDGNTRAEKAIAKVQEAAPFLHQIELAGQDDEGDWSASGAIVCTRNGVICWFYKEYDDDFTRNKIDRVGKFAYISNPSTLGELTGEYELYGSKNKEGKKGQWTLKIPSSEQKHEDSNIEMMH